MQIRIDDRNIPDLVLSARRNFRSVAQEGNAAIEDYLRGQRDGLKAGSKMPKSKKGAAK